MIDPEGEDILDHTASVITQHDETFVYLLIWSSIPIYEKKKKKKPSGFVVTKKSDSIIIHLCLLAIRISAKFSR